MPISLDLRIVLAVQRLMMSSSWSIALAIFLARWLILVEVALAIACLFSKRAELRHAVQEAAWAAGIALIVTSALSLLIRRVRPYLASVGVALLIPPPFNTSFPSGHTATAFAIAGALSLADWRVGAMAYLIAVLTAFGRVAVGVHYPSDILGGILVGLLSVGIVRTGHVALRSQDIARSVSKRTQA